MERQSGRARCRLFRDLRVLREEPLHGVAAEPLEEDIFVWHANLQLRGEAMHFEIYVPDTYPMQAPSVFFPTGLPHPNCFPQRAPDGRESFSVCLDMLGNASPQDEVGSGWSSAYDMRGLLAQLQAFILDDHNLYHRAGALTMRQALSAAQRYCCPHCLHKPGKIAPAQQAVEPRKRLTLLRSLAPPSSKAPPQVGILPVCLLKKVQRTQVLAELRPWRDVQRLATHIGYLASQQTIDNLCFHSSGEGFQKPSKARTIRCERAAEMSTEMRRLQAALRIQVFVRACLARALTMCLRRFHVLGVMPVALRAAHLESIKMDKLASSLGSSFAKAQEAEAFAKVVLKEQGTVEERAFAAARDALGKKRRNLEKKLKQLRETASKPTELTPEEKAKIARKSAVEKELRMLDSISPIPSALARCKLNPQEKKDAATSGFFELFREAMQAERNSIKKTKGRVRQERRFAQCAAAPALNKASAWPKHIDIARTVFIDMRYRQHRSSFRRELCNIVNVWHRAASLRQCRSCQAVFSKRNIKSHEIQCARSISRPCKDGSCHLQKVPYVLQIGVLLPMLTYQNLLILATVSRRMGASAEDGCLWSAQMSRCYPLSLLTPKLVKDWKYVFQCELRQALASLECYHTKTSILDNATVVLGIPIEFTINPKTQETDYIYSSMDFLSHDAFAVDKIRKTAYNEDFSHWLPLYLSEDHWRRALPHLRRPVVQLLPQHRGSFRPEMIVELFSKMINTLVVLICDKGLVFSDRAAKAFCMLHRLALRCMEEWPELRRYIDGRVDSFCKGQQHRSKEVEPNLGEFMALLLISSRPWSRVAAHALEERMDREVLWLCTECPALANLSGGAAPTDERRLEESWKARLVGKRLFAFHASCLGVFKDARTADDIARDYDRFYGQPSQAILNKFRQNTQLVLDMNDWDTFYSLVRVRAPSRVQLAEMLRSSVKNSRRRGYHRDGMDFNRVHASGTSKILRKGESYMAAATLKSVDVEDHWAWADGATKYLDATCLVYDATHTFVGHIDYLRREMTEANGKAIKPGAFTHSGDQLDSTKQSGFHQIHVQLDGLPSTVQYLYITVSAFAGVKLRDIRQPSVRLLESAGGELCRYDVEGADGDKTAILMCVLHRRPERSTSHVARWALEAIGEVGFGAADMYGPIHEMIASFLKKRRVGEDK